MGCTGNLQNIGMTRLRTRRRLRVSWQGRRFSGTLNCWAGKWYIGHLHGTS
jgi:hypothetical protein